MPKAPKCVICKTVFVRERPLQKVCSFECAKEVARISGERRSRAETKERKEDAKTVSEWLDKAQEVFNKFIRLRDKDLPCISCGTTNPNVQYAAGHYRSRKAASHLRFNEDNVHKQCNAHCNKFLSGNTIAMREGMIKKIGLERVEAIKNDNRIVRWTIDDAKEIIRVYKQKIKEL